MENSNMINLINSMDIRKHLSDINYQFSVTEYAYLIWQCRTRSILQRHKEFTALIKSTSSCMIKGPVQNSQNLHKTIMDYMSMENKLIQRFKQNEASCFYVCSWNLNDRSDEDICYFSDYDKVYSYALLYAKDQNLAHFDISKRYIDDSNSESSYIKASYNIAGDMISINMSGEINGLSSGYEYALMYEPFENMWFDIPIPFKPGDIVCDCFQKKPFILTDTVPWFRKEHPPKRNTSTEHLTNMDMLASGYSVNEELQIKYNWLNYPYLNLEYYNGPLINENRCLLAYSLFKQNKINGDTLAKLIQIITAEHVAKKTYHDLDWVINDETKDLLGINKYKEANRHD